MRPYRLWGSSLCLCIAGKDNKHLIYLTVIVPVIFRKVDSSWMGSIYSLRYHCLRQWIILFYALLICIMLPIISHFIFGGKRTRHVKVDFQLTLALCQEIVTYRARHTIIAKAHFVEESGKRLFGWGSHKRLVRKLHQDNQTFLLTSSYPCPARSSAILTNIHTLCSSCRPRLSNLLIAHSDHSSINYLAGITRCINIIWEMLITLQRQLHGSTVLQRHLLLQSRLGGYSHHGYCHQHQGHHG